MVKVKRLLSVFLCLFIFFANTNALCAKAAPLSTAESKKIATAIDATTKSQSSSSDYSAALRDGKLTFIKSFQITGLEAPQNGRLLDDTATVTTDNGVSWDIPVLWVNNEGDLIKVGIELDDNVRSYPVFAFYLPAGYALAFGEKTTYDIKMPDFVTNLFSKTGVATLSNPERGITYITPTLPGKDKVLVRVPASYYEESKPSSQGESQEGMPSNDDPDIPWHEWSILNPDDLQYKDYNPDFSASEASDIAKRHGSQEAINAIGEDNVAWLVSYIKDVIEPEAVALLIEKFPAYAKAAESGELGKNLGVYIYYADKDSDPAVASIKALPNDTDGSIEYVLQVNAYYYYTLVDGALNDSPAFSDASDIELDTTIIHEIMHAMMDDYVRTGMFGMQYVADLDTYTYNADALFPEWFVEGIATAVGSPYQYWHDSLTAHYGYDGTSYSLLKEAYLADEEMHLDYSDGKSLSTDSDTRKSAYISGYLANVYLGYLAAKKYDGLDAITEYEDGSYSINSLVIRSGVNHILEELHDGKTLDDIIFEISEIGDTVLYLDTDDFADKFIANEDENLTDNGVSLAFCTMFLDYLEDNSYGEYVANGSILTDFTDLSQTLLSPDLLNNTYEVLELTDSKDMVKSTVDPLLALTSGGKSEDGITTLEDLNGNLAAFPASNVAMSAGDSSDTDAKANETAASDTKLKAGASDDSDAKVKTEEATAAEAKAKAEGTVAADTKLTTGKAAVTDSKAKAEETVTADKKLTAGEAAVADAKAEEYTDADEKTKIGESSVADTKAKTGETISTDEKVKTVEAVVADAKQNAEESAASTKAGKATTDGEKSKVVETSNESAKSDSKETADSTNNKNDHSKDNARTLDSSKNSDAATASEDSETQTVLLTSKKSVPDDSSAAKSDTATAVEEETKEISSIFDAIQVGIDEHEEIAENRSVNNDTTASADTPANEVEPKSESTATEDAATTTKEDTQKSDSTDSSISQEDAHEDSNDNSGNDDSDQSQLTAEELKDVQAVKDAIASGQISSLTPDQLSLLSSGQVDLTGADTKTSDTAIQETAGQTASGDSIKDASKESDIKSTDDSTSGTAQDKSTGIEEKSIVSDNEKAESGTSENIESADKASDRKDETTGSSDSKSESSDTSSESSDAKSENSDAAPSSDSQAGGNDSTTAPSDSQAGGNDSTTAPSDSQASGNDSTTAPSDSQAGGNDATTAPSDTTGNEEAVTDTPAPEPTESVSEPDNIPAGIIISESEPEPEEAPDDNSEEQQILDAMPTSDDSEDDAAPEAPTPTE